MTFGEFALLFGHTDGQTDSVVHREVALPINIMAEFRNGTLEQHFGDVYKKNVALYVMRTKISQVEL